MASIKERYLELISLTQLFLLREYPLTLSSKKGLIRSSAVLLPPRPVSPTHPLPPMPSPHSPPSQQPLKPTLTPTEFLPPPKQSESPVLPPQSSALPEKSEGIGKMGGTSNSLALEPLATSSAPQENREFWQLLHTLFPQLTLCESVPKDALALKLKNAWLKEQMIPPVIILAFDNEEKHRAFLKNLAQAISLRLAPARVVSAPQLEKDKQWESVLNPSNVRLIIASGYGLYLQPGLMSYYREVAKQNKHFLNHIPLLPLADLTLYLKDPKLKSLLWRAICHEFASSQQRPSSPH